MDAHRERKCVTCGHEFWLHEHLRDMRPSRLTFPRPRREDLSYVTDFCSWENCACKMWTVTEIDQLLDALSL